MVQIEIKNLSVYAHHGVYDQERVLGQRFYVTIVADCNLEHHLNCDVLTGTTDYAALSNYIVDFVAKEKFQLIESLAGALAEAILKSFPKIAKIKVTIKKPHAAIAHTFEYVAVSVTRDRQ